MITNMITYYVKTGIRLQLLEDFYLTTNASAQIFKIFSKKRKLNDAPHHKFNALKKKQLFYSPLNICSYFSNSSNIETVILLWKNFDTIQ